MATREFSRYFISYFHRPSAANLPSFASFLFFLLRSLFALFHLSFFLVLMWLCFRVFPPSLLYTAYYVYTRMLGSLPRFDFFHLFFTILLDTFSPSPLRFPLCFVFSMVLHVLSHYLRNDLIAHSYVILTAMYADTICDI